MRLARSVLEIKPCYTSSLDTWCQYVREIVEDAKYIVAVERTKEYKRLMQTKSQKDAEAFYMKYGRKL